MKIDKKEFLEIQLTDIKRFQTYLYECEYADASVKKYVTDVETFFHYMKNHNSLYKTDLINYKKWLIEHYAKSSVNSMLVALNQFLAFMNFSKWKLKRLKI